MPGRFPGAVPGITPASVKTPIGPGAPPPGAGPDHCPEGPVAEPLSEPGWYRLAEHGWEPADAETAEAEVAAGGGWDLVHVTAAGLAEETPLF